MPSFLSFLDDLKTKMFKAPKSPSDNGAAVINSPVQLATGNWANPERMAIYRKGNPLPSNLNGISFSSWSGTEDWANVSGQMSIHETPLVVPKNMRAGSGVIILEKDGRVWLVHPTNQYGGYQTTFPKGGQEEGLSLQANAIKEAWEESGLKVKITGIAIDVKRTTSVARYYWAVRVGGTPKDMGWESEAVSLVPKKILPNVLRHPADKTALALILNK